MMSIEDHHLKRLLVLEREKGSQRCEHSSGHLSFAREHSTPGGVTREGGEPASVDARCFHSIVEIV